ncbi:GNAT family N-acetyltransferase [Pseudomonas oryzihabitans]|uniref:GNAT family N-acetyltransferase n=1 Tax=Pseudomonas oryzihabitans TaxID=47885 RepID=UPI0024BFEAD8|nr:GNAT family N-acetyltransferase [Pseudomonas oryzihabitans]MCI1009242.1 GNAT family N-acetyltransferase [Pseudomonas oryzihabitans]
MKIQRLGPEHAQTYRQLMLEAYAVHPDAFTSSPQEREALPLSWWESRLSADAQTKELVWAAMDGAALLGVAGLSLEKREKARHKATLFGMYVPDRYRRLGIGKMLVAELLTHAKHSQALKVVQLTVTEGNHAAQALYEKSGFISFGTEPMAVAVGDSFVSKVHMWCDLTELRR